MGGIVGTKKKADKRERPLFTGKARPHYVSEQNVFDAAMTRIRWLFDEFNGKITVSNSGGKDSTVVLELALMVAKERGQKLHVMWLDQECEYQATVEYQRYIASRRDEIDFDWYQIPFRLFNATNHSNEWLRVWGEGEDWVRPKEPYSIHENTFLDKDGKPIERFKKLLKAINDHTGGAILTGMRAEESPSRRVFLVSNPVYKWVTWGSGPSIDVNGEPYWMFHPIYDWTFRDVWHCIYEHGWRYNEMYEKQYRYGVPTRSMRVSNYHHSQAIGSLSYLQEAEPETWEAATRRLEGISTQGHVGKMSEAIPSLPYMFSDWTEYMHHLIDNLADERHRPTFRRMHESMVKALPGLDPDIIARQMVSSVIKNDYTGTNNNQFLLRHRGKLKMAREQESVEDLMMGDNE